MYALLTARSCSLACTLHEYKCYFLELGRHQGPSEYLLNKRLYFFFLSRWTRGFKTLYRPLSPSGTPGMLGNQELLGILSALLQDVLFEWPGYSSRIHMCNYSSTGMREPIFSGTLYLSINTQHRWTQHIGSKSNGIKSVCMFYILRIALFTFPESYLLLTSYFWASITCNR